MQICIMYTQSDTLPNNMSCRDNWNYDVRAENQNCSSSKKSCTSNRVFAYEHVWADLEVQNISSTTVYMHYT